MIKIIELLSLGPSDWSTLVSGIITAVATMGAVIYTNHKSNKQLKAQENKYSLERKQHYQQSKYVVVKPTLLLTTLFGILDRLIINSNYNRVLLFSGKDGFDFIDDNNKCINQKCRLLLIENNTELEIKDIFIHTKTVLKNMNTDEQIAYSTKNHTSLLRGHESMIIRLTDQQQFERILDMNEKNISHSLDFECKIEYLTLANQRVKYIYQINILNDRRIEIVNDDVQIVQDDSEPIDEPTTIFRNLQDIISCIDRSKYTWQKMGEAQMKGALLQFNSNNNKGSIENEKDSQ